MIALPVVRRARNRGLRRDSRRSTVEVVLVAVTAYGGWVGRERGRRGLDGYRRLVIHDLGRIGRRSIKGVRFHVCREAASRARKWSRRCLGNCAMTMMVRSSRGIAGSRWNLMSRGRCRKARRVAERRRRQRRERSRVSVARRIQAVLLVRAASARVSEVRVVRRKGGRSGGACVRGRCSSRWWCWQSTPHRAHMVRATVPLREIADIAAVLVQSGSRRGRRWQTVLG